MSKTKHIMKLNTFIIMIVLIIIACEPISVSVNSKGEIAFTRSEGLFYINLKTKKLKTVVWNYGKKTIPTIVKWSPDDQLLAYTVKASQNSQETFVYIIGKDGHHQKEVYYVSKIITQLEWSNDGKYLTVSQSGDDDNLSVADIVLISLKDQTSKIVIKNASDVHKWYNDSKLIFMKINKKDPLNDVYKGNLSLYDIISKETKTLLPVLLVKIMSLDYNRSRRKAVFTALKIGKKAGRFDKTVKPSESYAYLYQFSEKSKRLKEISEKRIHYAHFSSNGKNILVKAKVDNKVELAYINLQTNEFNTIENNTLDQLDVRSIIVNVYPTWLDDQNILFWRLNNVYGSNGQALELMSINISTLKKQNHQVMINSVVHQLIEKRGGYH